MRGAVILLGPPGAGKGTIARRLVDEIDLYWLSSGELLRAQSEQGLERSEEIGRQIDAGHLVGDKLIVELVTAKIATLGSEQNVLLDGFPRNLSQAQALASMEDQIGLRVSLAVELKVDRGETERRILKRQVDEGRADDTLTTLRRRMAHFEDQTVPVSGFYRQRHLLQEVDGMGTPQQVLDRILPLIRQAFRPRGMSPQKEAG